MVFEPQSQAIQLGQWELSNSWCHRRQSPPASIRFLAVAKNDRGVNNAGFPLARCRRDSAGAARLFVPRIVPP